MILKFNYTSCACLSCYLQKELVSIVGSYCTLSLKSLVATLHKQQASLYADVLQNTVTSYSVYMNPAPLSSASAFDGFVCSSDERELTKI